MKNKIVIALAVALLIGLVYIFFSLFEHYESVEDQGWSEAARRNPYLAAELFLKQTGVEVTSSYNFDELSSLPERGMVFISDASKTLTRKRVDDLLAWVSRGGHLVVAAPVSEDGEEDPLLSRFKISNREVDVADDDKEATREQRIERAERQILDAIANRNQQQEQNIPDDEITELSFEGVKHRFRMHFSPYTSLHHPSFDKDESATGNEEHKPFYWAGSQYGVHFIQLYIDQGLISIISDKAVWNSNNIGTLDHAYLLWFLSEGMGDVVLLYGIYTPSLLDYAWRYLPEWLVIFAVWLLAWLVYRSRRFGPVRRQSAHGHRSIAEHIQASAEYLWNEDRKDILIDPVRADVLRRLQHVHPGYSHLSQSEQLAFIVQHTGLDQQRIHDALIKPFDGREKEFTSVMQDLQFIRNTL